MRQLSLVIGLLLFCSEYIIAQNYIVYRPSPPNRPYYYQALYLDTINLYYYIKEVGRSEGTYNIINDSTIKLNPIIADLDNIEIGHQNVPFTKKSRKRKTYFQIKHYLIRNNDAFNFYEDKVYDIHDFFSAIYVELIDGRIWVAPFSDATLVVDTAYALVSGWIKKMPSKIKSVRFVHSSFSEKVPKKGRFIQKGNFNPIVYHTYKTQAIDIQQSKGSCICIETLFMNRYYWQSLSSSVGDTGDTLIFLNDKKSARLINYGWDLKRTEEVLSDEKIIKKMNSLTDILKLYSNFRENNARSK